MTDSDILVLVQAVLHSEEDDLKAGLTVAVEVLHLELTRRETEKKKKRKPLALRT